MTICPHCKQPLPIERFGARLSPLKARIVDIVAHAGDEGILEDALLSRHGHPMTRRTMQVHISQINDAIEQSGMRIVSYQHRRFLMHVEKRACV